MKYRNPLQLLDEIERLNRRIEEGTHDLAAANLMIRGHANAARVLASHVAEVNIALRMGVLTRENAKSMLLSDGAGEK